MKKIIKTYELTLQGTEEEIEQVVSRIENDEACGGLVCTGLGVTDDEDPDDLQEDYPGQRITGPENDGE